MAESTAVHSNAFNFTSYLSAGVDPRTGQYTFSVNLPGLNCNFLQGPVFEFPLFYSPLNTVDSGYGRGWTLRLSQFDPDRDIVSLASGETFKVTGKEAGKPWVMKEKKLDTFHLYPHGSGRYRIVHRSGTVEVLQPMFSRNIAVPVEIYAEQGHGLYLRYEEYNGYPRLASITQDDGQTVLEIKRQSNQVQAQTFPHLEGVQERMAFTLVLGADERVDRLVLPTQEQASWRFSYEKKRDLWCIVEVQTPTGGTEVLRYEDEGHAYPGTGQSSALPRVTRHILQPGFEQPPVEKGYGYELDPSKPDKHNFLGFGLPINWQEDGLDNLLRHVGKYEYGSVETWYAADAAGNLQSIRAITRTFNQFHLQVGERTVQGDNVQASATTYNIQFDNAGNVVDFALQPANFQLPTRQTASWWHASAPAITRAEQELTTYDGFGNLLERTEVNGVTHRQVWYEATQDSGHDADAEGFVRHLKESTVVPATTGQGVANQVITRYAYVTHPALDNTGDADVEVAPWYALEKQTMLEALPSGKEQQWQETTYQYDTDQSLRWKYGRPLSRVQVMAGGSLASAYAYSQKTEADARATAADFAVLETVETLTGSVFLEDEEVESTSKVITTQHLVVLDEPLLSRDDNDVEIRYQYDALHRVTCETVAPGKPEEASRRYVYNLCAEKGQQASQLMYDVKSVATCSEFDGLNRVIAEQREDVDALIDDTGAMHPTYSARYNTLGELVEEVEIDWVEKKPLPLITRYRYDDWGQQCCVIGPDLVHAYEQRDPVGVAEHDGVVLRAWQEVNVPDEQGDECWVKSGATVTWLNLFDKPVRTERLDLQAKPISLKEDSYDGLGRHTREVIDQRINAYTYDVFDRLLEHTLPYSHKVVRGYAAHSADDLPVSIEVSGKLLGEQSFDGLGRMLTATTGGRLKTYAYEQSQRRPKTVTMTTGAVVEYGYTPLLVDEPVYRKLQNLDAHGAPQADHEHVYDYDAQNGRLLSCDTGEQKMSRSYYSTGQVKEETRVYAAAAAEQTSYTMTYGYSLKDRLTRYEDVLGGVQTYHYDAIGRLTGTALGSTTADFTYDAFGRSHTTTTRDGDQQLVTTLTYDEFDREVLRQFDFGDGKSQSLTQVYNDIDNLVQRTLREGSTILRDEFYTYDLRNRLVLYECKGEGDQPALQAPEDPWGNVIAKQVFGLDELDNITLLTTTDAAGKLHRTRYLFENQDPAQLSSIVHQPSGGSRQTFELSYDANGNMTVDDAGRQLTYDGLNRLLEVTAEEVTQQYHYDAQDVLTGTSGSD